MPLRDEELARLEARRVAADRLHAVKGEQARAADEAVAMTERRMHDEYGVDGPEALEALALAAEAEEEWAAKEAVAALAATEEALR